MKKLLKSILVLVCICSFIAVLLALTNDITAPIIQKNESAAANAALLEVMPDGKSFEIMDISTYTLPATVSEAYKAENGGYVFKLTTTGYSSNFVIMCGINADGSVSGAVCIGSTETLGYEKTYGDSLKGSTTETIESVALISGATKTTGAYRSAVKDAMNASVILGGGSVDLRTEEEILLDTLAEALPAGEGKFTKLFITEDVSVDEIYAADNGAGYVCIIGEAFVATDASGALVGEASESDAAAASAAVALMSATASKAFDHTAFEGLPSAITAVEKTATGNYIITIKGAGYGINGGDEYHPASGEYIVIRVCISSEGKILDCLTVSQAETKGIGDVCADESFYGQFDGKTEENYKSVDAISGATLTTNGYLKAIERALAAVKTFEGGAANE